MISHLNQFANKPDGLGHNAPLLQACRNPIILKGLLEQGADVNSINDNGESCLHKLFESTENEQELAIIELLIERGININHQSATGETALFKLAQSKSHFSKWQDYKNKLYVDLLCCCLDNDEFKREMERIEQELDIRIRYSHTKLGYIPEEKDLRFYIL